MEIFKKMGTYDTAGKWIRKICVLCDFLMKKTVHRKVENNTKRKGQWSLN